MGQYQFNLWIISTILVNSHPQSIPLMIRTRGQVLVPVEVEVDDEVGQDPGQDGQGPDQIVEESIGNKKNEKFIHML